MEGQIALGVLGLLVLLDVLALRWGADSREGFGGRAAGPRRSRRAPLAGVVASVVVRADAAGRTAIGFAGAALVAVGTRLQRLALGSVDSADLEPAAW